MASSTGPVRAGPAAIAALSGVGNAARGRSTSPGQYTSHGLSARGPGRAESTGMYAMSAWPEATTGSMASPRTPRQTHGNSELRLSVAVGELQRQADAERRNTHKQLQQLERRFQEQMSTPVTGRERWADLQGSVSGMLEEMSGLARRLDGLEEKLRLRTGACEELTRQRTRELEQQVHAHEHKAHLAVTTSEESMKRQAAKMRKVTQALEDHVRRLDGLEELRSVRRPEAQGPDSGLAAARLLELDARFQELEQRQVSFEEEVRTLPLSSEAVGSRTPYRSGLDANGEGSKDGAQQSAMSDDDDDPVLRALEHDLSSLASRTASQLDEHAAALANLRVRTDATTERLVATTDRLDTLLAPPLQALRSEVAQLREHDRQELDSRLEGMKRHIQSLSEASEEMAAESRDRLREVKEGFHTASARQPEQHPILQQHDQALRRLESLIAEPQERSLVSPEEFCAVLMRADSLEQRVDFLEKDGDEQGLSEKADRTEVLRVEAAVRELSEPLRRLSQRAAQGEARSAALERRVEQLQQHHVQEQPHSGDAGASSAAPVAAAPSEEVASALMRVDVISDQVAELKARIIDVESLIEGGSANVSAVSLTKGSSQAFREVDVSEQIEDLRARVQKLSGSSDAIATTMNGTLADKIDQALRRVSKTEQEITSIKETKENGHPERIEDAVRRIASSEEATTALQKDLEQLISELQEQMDKLQNKFDTSGTSCNESREETSTQATQGLQNQLDKLRDDVAAMKPELSTQTLQKQLDKLRDDVVAMKPTQTFQKQFEKLQDQVVDMKPGITAEAAQALQKDVQTSQTSLKELSKQVEKAMAMVEASEAASMAVREELMCSAPASGEDASEKQRAFAEAASALREALEDQKIAFTSHQTEARKASEGHTKALNDHKDEAAKALENHIATSIKTEAAKALAAHRAEVTEALAAHKSETVQTLDDQIQKFLGGREADASLAPDSIKAEALESHKAEVAKVLDEQKADVSKTSESLRKALEAHQKAFTAHQDEASKSSKAHAKALEDYKAAASKALEHHGATASKALDEHKAEALKTEAFLKKAIASHKAEAGEKVDAHDVTAPQCVAIESKVAELSEKVASELLELQKHQKELAGTKAQLTSRASENLVGNGDSRPDHPMVHQLETGLEDLSRQVATELKELRDHQRDLIQAKESMGGMSKVADEVARMSSQVADELQELRIHQEDLRQVKASLSVRERTTVSEQAGSAVASQGSSQMEAKVEDLAQQVVAELRALTTHQDELKSTKVNIRDLSEQMNDNVRLIGGCQKAVLDLKESLEQLKLQSAGAAAPASTARAEEAGERERFLTADEDLLAQEEPELKQNVFREWSRTVPHTKDSAKAASPPRIGVGSKQGGAQAAASSTVQPAAVVEDVSEVSESYDNEAFDEADEDSMSAS